MSDPTKDFNGYDWKPAHYHNDPMVNAVLNVAKQLNSLAVATDGLLYGLKYGAKEGMSIAEAIEKAGESISQGFSTSQIAMAIESISTADNGSMLVAESIDGLAQAVAERK